MCSAYSPPADLLAPTSLRDCPPGRILLLVCPLIPTCEPFLIFPGHVPPATRVFFLRCVPFTKGSLLRAFQYPIGAQLSRWSPGPTVGFCGVRIRSHCFNFPLFPFPPFSERNRLRRTLAPHFFRVRMGYFFPVCFPLVHVLFDVRICDASSSVFTFSPFGSTGAKVRRTSPFPTTPFPFSGIWPFIFQDDCDYNTIYLSFVLFLGCTFPLPNILLSLAPSLHLPFSCVRCSKPRAMLFSWAFSFPRPALQSFR